MRDFNPPSRGVPVRPTSLGKVVQAGPPEELAPWKPTPQDPWNLEKAAHLLRRAGFGPTPEELEFVLALGPDRTVDALLTTPPHPVPTHGTHVLPTGEVLNLGTLAGQRAMLLYTQAHTPYPFQEKMTAFWLDHFSVGLKTPAYPEPMGTHAATLRALALSSFKEILLAVTKDPAMLVWLDNWLSRAKKPNENYGRELLELYTMGEGNGYTEDDVKAASRALTGHTLRPRNQYYFNPSTYYHDYGKKVFLGKTIYNAYPKGAKDLDDLIDIILGHPATAKFMVRKIWEYFVYLSPDQVLVDYLADVFRKDGYSLRSLMGLILRSKAFFSPRAYRRLVKDPLDFCVGLSRFLHARLSYTGMGYRVVLQGYPLLNFENPSGLPDGTAWINSQSLIERANFAEALIQQGGYTNLKASFDPFREIRRKGLKNEVEIVDHYLLHMVDGKVPPAIRTSLIDYMNRIDSGPRKFDIHNANHVKQKVSGLVHLVAALPEYQMK